MRDITLSLRLFRLPACGPKFKKETVKPRAAGVFGRAAEQARTDYFAFAIARYKVMCTHPLSSTIPRS
jgi:hypothetical protein